MSKVEITFKSGSQIVADADEFIVSKSGLAGVTGLRWTTPAYAERALMHLDIESIAAVVFIHEPGDRDEPEEPSTEQE